MVLLCDPGLADILAALLSAVAALQQYTKFVVGGDGRLSGIGETRFCGHRGYAISCSGTGAETYSWGRSRWQGD